MSSHQVIGLDLRHTLPSPSAAPASGDPAASCTESCPEWATRAEQAERERLTDMAAVMGVVHEAVAAVGAEMCSLQDDLHHSTARFDTIVALDDPQTIKARLIAELRTLKLVVVARKASWENASRGYVERMSHMEQELTETRTQASTDALTGLANRRTFDRHLQRRLQTPQSRFVLGVIDVDNFKTVNDTYGHAVGDQVLLAIARSLAQSVRPGDIVARLGGDEFAVIASDVTLRQAEYRFNTVLAAIGEATLSQRAGDILMAAPPTISCGLAEFSAGDTDKSLFERADAALYDAKRSGKSRVASREPALTRDLMRGGER